MGAKPVIRCLPNGPYYLVYEPSASAVPYLVRESGESCASPRAVALCRCGGSKSKPFCDGTHLTNGFSDARTADPAKNRRDTYAGKTIAIHDNRAICAHAGYCTDHLPEVFREDGSPWIDPDASSADAIVDVVNHCPSGALSCSIDGKEWAPDAREPRMVVTKDGPYAVSGGIELAGVAFGDGASREHYTLCRCGASANKPFCDGSHWSTGFRDP